MDKIQRASQRIADRLTWCTAHRDQAGIAKDLAEGKDISEVYGLGEAGLFDEFFYFLDQFGIMDLFMALDPKHTARTSNVSFPAVILIYLMRIVAGLAFFWHVAPVILRSQPLMRIVGFNGTQTRDGTSRRGKTCSAPSDPSTEADTSEIRGPICPDSIATYIQAISSHALERLFNRVVSILAAHSFFPKHIHALLDSSEIQSTELCEGCGKVTKEKAPALRHRRGRIRKVLETVFGFKVWVVWDPTSRLPLALRFATIEHSDIDFAREVVQQAVNNLAPHAKIVSLAIDRGFIDGPFLWWLEHTMGIIFYIPAKTNMNVYDDALSLVDTGIVQTRERKRSQGAGKNKTTVMDRWHVVGIPGLTSAGFYGEKGSGSHENRSDFIPNPLNAVVVYEHIHALLDSVFEMDRAKPRRRGQEHQVALAQYVDRLLERIETDEAAFRRHVHPSVELLGQNPATVLNALRKDVGQGNEFGGAFRGQRIGGGAGAAAAAADQRDPDGVILRRVARPGHGQRCRQRRPGQRAAGGLQKVTTGGEHGLGSGWFFHSLFVQRG